jgi:hypothetical protein
MMQNGYAIIFVKWLRKTMPMPMFFWVVRRM